MEPSSKRASDQKDNRQDEDRGEQEQDFGEPLPVETLERLADDPQLHAERALLWWETYASDDWKGALG